MRRLAQRVGLIVATLAFGAAPSLACSVCYGAADDPILDGAQAAIVFMLGLTYAVVGGGVAMVFVMKRHRAARVGEETNGQPAGTT